MDKDEKSCTELSLEQMLKNTIQSSIGTQQIDKNDEQCDQLISKQSQEHHLLVESVPQPPIQDEIIDPIHELVKNNNVVPLLAVLDMVDLTTEIEGKPLLSRLCTMNIPLDHHLKNREIIFKNDNDNRTALHDAIAADDTLSANWCFQHKIGNVRDNFGNTPILEAIRLGRKSCFLLCLHYQYYDSEAPQICATYNRHWELKVLHRLGFDVVSARDSQHFTPLQRSVANYSYEAAEYLTQITNNVSPNYLSNKTDSKGIIRLITKTIQKNSTKNIFIIPLLKITLNLLIVYYFLNYCQFYSRSSGAIQIMLLAIGILYVFLFVLGWSKQQLLPHNINFMALLRAPQFPILEDICPECMVVQDPHKNHCRRCGKCVQRYHFHQIACVNKRNQIFWFFIEIFWFYLIYQLHQIMAQHLKSDNLLILNFSNNFFFVNAAILEKLATSDSKLLLWFIYLKIFLLYQFLCCFQWLAMMVLDRTYGQINNTQKFKRLYRIVRTDEGSFKSQQIRIMQRGFIYGVKDGIQNIIAYFFK